VYRRRNRIAWILAAIGWIGMSVALMLVLRSNVIGSFDEDAAEQWQAWRDHVEQEQQERVPVKRRVPPSELPPAYVLMQDYFGVCLVAGTVFSFLLFAVFSFLIMGVLSDSTSIDYLEDDPLTTETSHAARTQQEIANGG
tara:strand:- start:261 stop:680 length:420 start_codon:yes stop_codon:yes gene_type:complete